MLGRGLAVVLALALAGCGGSDEEPPPGTVSGPLCELLPSGDDPGAPQTLVGEPAGVVLKWIPVATTFEAAVRRSGIDLRDVTILAPTDDAFTAAFERQALDEVLLSRARSRELVEQHVLEDVQSLADLRDAGEATTLAGDTLEVTEAGAMARFGDRATTVCADYAAADARIHVVDGVFR
jgi:Fasciclin domain